MAFTVQLRLYELLSSMRIWYAQGKDCCMRTPHSVWEGYLTGFAAKHAILYAVASPVACIRIIQCACIQYTIWIRLLGMSLHPWVHALVLASSWNFMLGSPQ